MMIGEHTPFHAQAQTHAVETARRPGLSHRNRHGHAGVRSAFTIIELLVVTAIVIVLLSILVVAVNAAKTSALKTNTAGLMNSMKQALVRFKEDVGYFPPVLGPNNGDLRDLFTPPLPLSATPSPAEIAAVQDWWSSCSLADYLIGYGDENEDGHNGPGIRNPGGDGYWNVGVSKPACVPAGAPVGTLLARRAFLGTPACAQFSDSYRKGKPLGPYFQLDNPRLLAAVDYDSNGNLNTYFPGDPLPNGMTWEAMPKAIVDYWGMPIRYYRRPYPQGAIGQSYRPGVDYNNNGNPHDDVVPTLSNVFLVRPQTIKSGSESVNAIADASGHDVSSRDLDAAEFALLSSGPDRRVHQAATLHEDNADNLVEVGP